MEANQTVKKFLLKLAEDEEFREKIEAAVKRRDRVKWLALSHTAGFDFTQADLEYLADLSKAAANGELNEAQLEMVSGGLPVHIAALPIQLPGLVIH
ncbi:MAG TPA: Nif11-like leader peptide family RiPP precursor [Bacillota bacterium]|nr:Nif11-like leader peptide family RiPP precursor [Bacillota bacterium]